MQVNYFLKINLKIKKFEFVGSQFIKLAVELKSLTINNFPLLVGK